MRTRTHPQDYNRRVRPCPEEVWQKFLDNTQWYDALRQDYLRGLLSKDEYERMYLQGPKVER